MTYDGDHAKRKQPVTAFTNAAETHTESPRGSYMLLSLRDTWSLCNGVRWAANFEFAKDEAAPLPSAQ